MLVEIPPAVAGALPAEVRIEIVGGKLFGVNPDEACISLVPTASTRFAIPENPALSVEFYMNGEDVEKLTVSAGEIAAIYQPRE